MLAEHKTKTNIGIGLGILLQFTGSWITRTQGTTLLGPILALIGSVFFIWGCMNYAAGKGHSQWLGLLGLLSCLGLLILVLLPDHHK